MGGHPECQGARGETTTWDSFFGAEVGASAALAGLIFVGVSINLTRIIALPTIANRALQSLLLLVGLLSIASLLLVPGQTSPALGIETLAVSIPLWVVLNYIEVRSFREAGQKPPPTLRFHAVEIQLPCALAAIGGISLIVANANAMYWFVPATILVFLVAIVESWVILVEINR